MIVNIDQGAGFCSGVRRAIRLAEKELGDGNQLFCLGQIVHNEAEVARLESMGMQTINKDQLKNLRNSTVLIRAHGEPPETYSIAEQNNIRLIDGTCPTVLRLQAKVKKCFKQHNDAQIALFGKRNHPEVIGLNGQTNFTAVILEKPEDIEQLDFSRPVCLFAQTTQNENEYHQIVRAIKAQKIKILANEALHFTATESICKQVSRRESSLRQFANENDIVLFGSFYGIKTDVREDLMQFINQAREKQALIFYDPNFRAAHLGILNEVMPFIEENIQKCSIVKGSNEDFYNMFNLDNPEEVYKRISSMGQQNLIYTANKHGVTLITKNIHKHYPVEDINTKSTVGAGDSFNAGLIYACIKHDVSVQNLNELRAESWDDIIAIAIEFASHVCLSTQNCVSLDFARRMKYEAFKQ